MSPAESTPQTKSPGARTPEGKAISSMNALRHGLTGRVVVLPSEDMNVYNAFCKELMADLAPETPLERQYARVASQLKFDKVYLEVYRNGQFADQASLAKIKKFFAAHGIAVSGGVTLAAGGHGGQFGERRACGD